MRADRNRESRYSSGFEYMEELQRKRINSVKISIILILGIIGAAFIIQYIPYMKAYMSEGTVELILKSDKKYSEYIDISAIELSSDDKILDKERFTYYNNLQNKGKSIVYIKGNKESRLIIDKNNLSSETAKIKIYCTVYSKIDQTFEDIKPNLRIIYKDLSGLLDFEFDLSSPTAGGTVDRKTLFNDKLNCEYKTLKIVELVKDGETWVLHKLFEESNDDLQDILNEYELEAMYSK